MPLAHSVPLAGSRVGHDVHEFLATLRDADLLQVTWPENGLRKGFDVFIECANQRCSHMRMASSSCSVLTGLAK